MPSGKVFNGELLLSEVRYSLGFDQNYQDVSGPTTAGIIPTDAKYALIINAQSPAIRAGVHERLTLQLEDGRRLDFYWWPDGAHVTNGIY